MVSIRNSMWLMRGLLTGFFNGKVPFSLRVPLSDGEKCVLVKMWKY